MKYTVFGHTDYFIDHRDIIIDEDGSEVFVACVDTDNIIEALTVADQEFRSDHDAKIVNVLQTRFSVDADEKFAWVHVNMIGQ